MKMISYPVKLIAVILSGFVLFSSCTSTTMIQSVPAGAKLYIDGEPAGTTPYAYMDTKIVGSSTTVKLEKEGYQPFMTSFSRSEEADVGAIIGGVFVLVPFLWTMKYKPTHTYELTPLVGEQQPAVINPQNQINTFQGSKADQLRELKNLMDEKVITPAEFEAQKKKILESDK